MSIFLPPHQPHHLPEFNFSRQHHVGPLNVGPEAHQADHLHPCHPFSNTYHHVLEDAGTSLQGPSLAVTDAG